MCLFTVTVHLLMEGTEGFQPTFSTATTIIWLEARLGYVPINNTGVNMLVRCKNCNKEFDKLPNQARKHPNHFCSRSCAASFNNKGKQKNPPKQRFGNTVSHLFSIKLRRHLMLEYLLIHLRLFHNDQNCL